MKSTKRAPSYKGLVPASPFATQAAKGSSAKLDTRPELLLRRALWSRGLRYRVDVRSLPGRPDIVCWRARVVVFCDGDFWHGRDLEHRLAKLSRGHNAPYWLAKIRANVERDHKVAVNLNAMGWLLLRFWESEIKADPNAAADLVLETVRSRVASLAHNAAKRCKKNAATAIPCVSTQ